MRVLTFALVLVLLPSCDSGGSDGGDCGSINVRSGGTISAQVGAESLGLSCYDVSIAAGRTFLIGYSTGETLADIRTPITIVIDGTSEGTYSLDGNGSEDDTDESYIQLSLGGDATSPAETGSIRVSEFTSTRLRGTFEFVTLNGVRVSGGVFDVSLSGVER